LKRKKNADFLWVKAFFVQFFFNHHRVEIKKQAAGETTKKEGKSSRDNRDKTGLGENRIKSANLIVTSRISMNTQL